MDRKDKDLERLCKIYLDMTDEEKEKFIRLGENLLNSQKSFVNEISLLSDNKEDTELKTV